MNDLASAVLRLAEDLTSKRRRRAVDPLIASMYLLVAARFRRQRAWMKTNGTLEKFKWTPFANQYHALMQGAREAGGDIAADVLDSAVQLGPEARTAADLTSEIDATTADRISSKIRDAVERGLTRDEMELELRGMFTEWASDQENSRSQGIALSEIAGAFNRGILDAARASGQALLKEWWADGSACPICLDNADDGPLTLDEPFSSGDYQPGAHPFCRCSLRLVAG